MKLFVANIPNNVNEEELSSTFKTYGDILSLKIITSKESGLSRGFGYVEMPENEGRKAIGKLNFSEIQGRRITVNEAFEK